jgi:Tripartite tricarboxylate transporter family receptor
MLIKHKPSHYLKMMYLGSTSYWVPGARCALESVGVDHFIFGTDAPPPKSLKAEGIELIKKLGLSPEDERKVYCEKRQEVVEDLTRAERSPNVLYRSSAQAVRDAVAGRVEMQFSTLPPAIPLIREGKLRFLGAPDVEA